MMVTLSCLRPFICRHRPTKSYNTRGKAMLFNSGGKLVFQAVTPTFVSLTGPSHNISSFFKCQCCSFKTISGPTLDFTRLTCKPNNGFRPNTLCRCQSSFNIKTLWEEGKTENTSKLSLKTKYEQPTAVKSNIVLGLKYPSDIQDELINSELDKALRQTDKINIDWDNLKKSILEIDGHINEENIDAIVMKKCCEMKSLQLGKQFFVFLKSSNTKINRATYGNYLRLFYDCSPECTEEDFKEIFNIYKEIQHLFNALDSNTAEKVVLALSITEHWKEYIKLFEIIEKIYFPTAATYSSVVKAAFKNGEFTLGWSLMEEMQIRGVHILDEVFVCILETNTKSSIDEILAKILEFMSKFNIKPSVNLSGIVKRTFEGISKDRRGTYTSVLRK